MAPLLRRPSGPASSDAAPTQGVKTLSGNFATNRDADSAEAPAARKAAGTALNPSAPDPSVSNSASNSASGDTASTFESGSSSEFGNAKRLAVANAPVSVATSSAPIYQDSSSGSRALTSAASQGGTVATSYVAANPAPSFASAPVAVPQSVASTAGNEPPPENFALSRSAVTVAAPENLPQANIIPQTSLTPVSLPAVNPPVVENPVSIALPQTAVAPVVMTTPVQIQAPPKVTITAPTLTGPLAPTLIAQTETGGPESTESSDGTIGSQPVSAPLEQPVAINSPVKGSFILTPSVGVTAPGTTGTPAKDIPADTELTLASAEGILKSQPVTAMMGGGIGYSLLSLAIPEETQAARLTRVEAGDRSYVVKKADRFQAAIPLVWVYLKNLNNKTYDSVEEMLQNGQFTWVEESPNGSQNGRIIRVVGCDTPTNPEAAKLSWVERWVTIAANVFQGVLKLSNADLCPNPVFRDFRVKDDKVAFDFPLGSKGDWLVLAIDPVKWLDPAYQESVGGKHLDDMGSLNEAQLKALIEHSEILQWLAVK